MNGDEGETGMRHPWLKAVLLPGGIQTRERPSPDSPEALGMVLHGRRRELQIDWDTGRAALPADLGEHAPLLAGALARADGALEQAADRFLAVTLRARDADRRTAAAVLASVTLWQLRRHRAATALLYTLDDAALDEVCRAVIDLHRGWQAAMRGSWQVAIEATEGAVQLAERAGAGALTRTLVFTGSLNALNYRARSGEVPEATDLGDPPILLAQRAETARQGLEALVDERLHDRLGRPFRRQQRWTAEDNVEAPLQASLVQEACRADYAALRAAQRRLGRVRLLRARATEVDPGAEAFLLLLDAEDAMETLRAATWYHHGGPLTGIIEAVQEASRTAWLPLQRRGFVALLRGAGDLVPATDAQLVANRLLQLVEQRQADVGIPQHEALQALARVMAALPADGHGHIAERLLALVNGDTDPIIALGLPHAVRAVRWEHVAESSVEAWREVVSAQTVQEGDTAKIAAAFLLANSRQLQAQAVGQTWAQEAALEALERHPTLFWTAVVLDSNAVMSEDVARGIVERTRQSLNAQRAAAAEGRRGFGGIEPAVVLCATLVRHPFLDGWDDLAEYVADPSSTAGTKSHVVDLLADRAEVLPGHVRDALAAISVEGIEGTAMPFEEVPVPLPGGGLRLAMALEVADPNSLAATLLGLAAAADAEDRAQAAWTLRRGVELLPTEGITLLRLLARDRSPDVRAAAGSTLAFLHTEETTACITAANVEAGKRGETSSPPNLLPEIRALLRDPGVKPVLAMLGSMGEEHDELPPGLHDDVAELAQEHPSGSVRSAAEALLG